MTAKVSYIIPAYNCGATIEETVASIYRGNFCPGDEVVIVNDGSTDDTSEVLEKIRQAYSDVRLVDHSRNKGGAAARNTAVETAQNDLIFCLDSDNLLVPDSVPGLRDFLLANKADVAAFRELHFFKESPEKPTHKWRYSEGQITFIDSLAGAVFPGASGNYLYTKASWIKAKGYPEFAGALDAWGLGVRQVGMDQKMMVMKEGHYLHRYGHESYWVRDSKRMCLSLIALQILIPFFDQLAVADVDYIMSREAREKWFNELGNRPLRAKNGSKGCAGEAQTMEGKSLDGLKKTVSCCMKERLTRIFAQGR